MSGYRIVQQTPFFQARKRRSWLLNHCHWNIRMDDKPDILFVNTHAKGIGGTDHWNSSLNKIILDISFVRLTPSGMKRFRMNFFFILKKA